MKLKDYTPDWAVVVERGNDAYVSAKFLTKDCAEHWCTEFSKVLTYTENCTCRVMHVDELVKEYEVITCV